MQQVNGAVYSREGCKLCCWVVCSEGCQWRSRRLHGE